MLSLLFSCSAAARLGHSLTTQHRLCHPALHTAQATYQLQWPATNPKRLAPRFVPLTEAETGGARDEAMQARAEGPAVNSGIMELRWPAHHLVAFRLTICPAPVHSLQPSARGRAIPTSGSSGRRRTARRRAPLLPRRQPRRPSRLPRAARRRRHLWLTAGGQHWPLTAAAPVAGQQWLLCQAPARAWCCHPGTVGCCLGPGPSCLHLHLPLCSKREWNRNRRSPSPPLEGVRDLREMLSRKASGGRSADAAGPSRGASEREAVQVPPGLGRAAERRSDPEPERRGRCGGTAPCFRVLSPWSCAALELVTLVLHACASPLVPPMPAILPSCAASPSPHACHCSRGREEHPVRTLDELFRKTAAKPCIYWLPLTGGLVGVQMQHRRLGLGLGRACPDNAASCASVAAVRGLLISYFNWL